MTIKLHCTVCGKYLKELPLSEAKAITGKETCGICSEKIALIFSDLDKLEKDSYQKINEMFEKVKTGYVKFSNLHTSTLQQIKCTIGNIRPEVEKNIETIFANKKKMKTKESVEEEQNENRG